MLNFLGILSLFSLVHFISSEDVRLVISPATNPVQKPAGHQISLLCTVKGAGNDKPGIMWKKHGGLDRTGNVQVKKLDDHTIGLVIRNSTIEDSGVYTCQVQVDNKVLNNHVDVIVFEDLIFVDKQLHFGQILATASVNISCQVTVKKDNVITYWTRHGKQLIEGGRFKFYDSNAILEIQSYQPEQDAGQYTCEVFHLPSGSSTTKTVNLGTTGEKNYVACQQMCNSFCTDVHNKMYTGH